MKRSTAEKKQIQQTKKAGAKSARKALLPWLVCAPLGALAWFLKFIAPGYGFSALVCCVLIFIIAFYAVTGQLLEAAPFVPVLRKVFTVCLVIGLLVVGATEALIIKASLGDPRQHCDYLVVLGAKVRESGPSASLWDRIYAARDYLTSHPDAIAVVSGGKGSDEPITEAKAMYDELVKLGIGPERIWMEDRATSTWENLNFTLDLIEEKTGTRPETLGILSSEYHLFRARHFAKECGVEAVGIPAETSRLSQKINHFMREVAGVWHYLILGGNYNA